MRVEVPLTVRLSATCTFVAVALVSVTPEEEAVRTGVPLAWTARIFPVPVWFKVTSVSLEEVAMVEVALVRAKSCAESPCRVSATKAAGEAESDLRGVISPSHEGEAPLPPISTPRYSGWFQSKSAGNAVTLPNCTEKSPFVTCTRLPPVRTSSQRFVVVAETAFVYRRNAMLYVPSVTAAPAALVSLAW